MLYTNNNHSVENKKRLIIIYFDSTLQFNNIFLSYLLNNKLPHNRERYENGKIIKCVKVCSSCDIFLFPIKSLITLKRYPISGVSRN